MVALPLAGQAQITRSGNGFLFRHKFHAGQTSRFVAKISATNRPGAAPFVTVVPMSEKVVSVKGKIANIDVVMEPMIMAGRASGKPMTSPIQVDDRGPVGSNAMMLYMQFGEVYAPFSDKLMHVGDVVEIDKAGDYPMLGHVSIAAHYKLEGMTALAGRKAARFSMAVTKKGRVDSTITGEFYVAADDGSTLKIAQTTVVKMAGGANMTQVVTAERH
jgi:hypothetical protein